MVATEPDVRPAPENAVAGLSARLFNSTLAVAAVVAADRMGILDELDHAGTLNPLALGRARDWHLGSLAAVLDALQQARIVEWSPATDRLEPGPGFAEVLQDKGYYAWLLRGYGEMLQNLGELTMQGSRAGVHVPRDSAAIALAGRDYGARFVDADVVAALGPAPIGVIADLGCGVAARLVGLVSANPGLRGIGIELSPEVLEVARDAVRSAGLGDRVHLVEADASDLAARPEFARVDTLMSFFAGHDLWPRDRCLRVLERLRSVFPKAGRFLLCDTYRSEKTGDDSPIFTLGFELTHAVMGQYVPSLQEWRVLFEESAWRCSAEHPIGIPFSRIFDLRRRDTE